ncbi:hypothetical protein QIS74_01984 [Colletotrichum tabaci]|uniref:Uncharacterized protein n=1 Tax=Colletotrichum tabaci TaxID=1209068 RepID=A0AAV9TTH9_9PEZI
MAESTESNKDNGIQDHTPHRLSIIEEASQEPPQASGNGTPKYDEDGFLEDQQVKNHELTEYEQTASNVGPHGTRQGATTNGTADTVLYGNWEQDNNLQDLDRASKTVIRFGYHGFYAEYDTTDSGSYSSSIHEVAKSQEDSTKDSTKSNGFPTTKDWSIFQSNLVDYGPDDPSPRLPGCSAGHPYSKTWKMSDSMMVAYGAMRGSLMQTNDTLRSWMEVKAYEAAIRVQQDEKAVTGLPDHSVEQRPHSSSGSKGNAIDLGVHRRSQSQLMLKEVNMAAKEYAPAAVDRKTAYNVPRPRFLHISPKFEGFKFEDYLPPNDEATESIYKQPFDPNRDFAKEYDVSDDEGDPASGRISPCTFRLLAEGCAKKDPKANQVYMADDAVRMRPPSPLEDSQGHVEVDRLAVTFELQRDINDGGWITPCYSVDTEPSIIYCPPGVNLKRKMRNWWFGLFDRMDPIAARHFRKIEFREANDSIAPLETVTEHSVPSTTSSERRHAYTDVEVLEALHAPGSRRVAGVAPQNAQLIISQRWQTVTRWKAQDAELARENDGMRGAIERAKMELREIRLTVDHLLQKKAAEELAMRQRKHNRVLRRVSAHLHELRYEIQSKLDALKSAQAQNYTMKAELAVLQAQIQEECSRADMASPDEVRRAVSQHFRDKIAAMEFADCF